MNIKNTFNPSGLYAAVVTPMHYDGSLNLCGIPRLLEWYQSQSLQGLFIAGTTGEGRQLTQGERIQLLEAIALQKPEMPYVVHVGHDSQLAMQELASHAQAQGAEAIALSPSSFHAIQDIDQLLNLYQPVCAAAPDLPAIHYHIPTRSACSVDPSKLLTRARYELPQLCGLKFTDESLMNLQRCMHISENVHIGFGRDEQLLSALAYGCRWAIGSTYNIAAPLYQALIAAFDSGDLARARALQFAAVELVQAMQQCGNGLAAIKIILAASGVDCGPVRAPLQMPEAEKAERLLSVFKSIQTQYGVTYAC